MNYKVISIILLILLLGLGAYMVYSRNDKVENTNETANTNIVSSVNNANSNKNTNAVSSNSNNNTSQSLPAGQEKVTGTFSESSISIAPGVLSFKTDSGKFFNFTNQTLAHTALKTSSAGTLGNPGCEYISGKAEIIISNYKSQDTTQSESTPTATLVSVSKISQAAHCSSTQP